MALRFDVTSRFSTSSYLLPGRGVHPMKMTISTNSIPLMETKIMANGLVPPDAMPTTMARTIIPRISSMTVVPMIILDSPVWVKSMSLITRAVMPTLVETIAAAMNKASISP